MAAMPFAATMARVRPHPRLGWLLLGGHARFGLAHSWCTADGSQGWVCVCELVGGPAEAMLRLDWYMAILYVLHQIGCSAAALPCILGNSRLAGCISGLAGCPPVAMPQLVLVW